ncbi:hypothetical protein CPB83DRAFT_909678 [Crepidotus variabilis]|uniref:Uncharacterized protein n=1 Tax=Crepidotus variabilis TaxID=179855 RepID=A0A9P6E913_9AGAR|nr:hypothetical protein CPB83DRAFT_909678 [Crepidotus variabilis]
MDESNERTALLSNPDPPLTLLPPTEPPAIARTHFIDNLRATLIVLLIAHHATLEVFQLHTVIPRLQIIILSLFTATNISCLWTTFFVVSGYSSASALQQYSASRPDIASPSSQGDEETDDLVAHQHSAQRIQGQSQLQRHPDLKYLLRYSLRTLLPAILYDAIGHLILFIFLSMSWERIFGSFKAQWAFMRLSGPVAYVYLLSILVYGHIGLRAARRWWLERARRGVRPPDPESTPEPLVDDANNTDDTRNAEPSPLLPSTSPKYIIPIVIVSMVILTTYTYFSCIYESLIPRFWLYVFVIIQYDFISPDAPVSYILGYILGVYIPVILARIPGHPRRSLLTRIPSLTWVLLIITLIISWASMGAAQHLSPSLYEHIRIRRYFEGHHIFVKGGFNGHTLFFVLWHTFNTFSIPFLTIFAFSSSEFTQKKWDLGFKYLGDSLVRRTAIIPYIHMIPIIVALHLFKPIVLNCITVIVLGVFGSWIFTLPAVILNL